MFLKFNNDKFGYKGIFKKTLIITKKKNLKRISNIYSIRIILVVGLRSEYYATGRKNRKCLRRPYS